MADAPKKKAVTPRRKKAKAAAASRGLSAKLATTGQPPTALEQLGEAVVADGGAVIGGYRDPLGGHWQLLVSLPIELLGPTPYQRDLSDPHVAKLADAISKLGRFLDPVIATRTADGAYWTPNGHHRLAAMRALGAQSITALLVPEPDIAHRMLVLNTEKAHNIRERSLAVIRLAEGLAPLDGRPEQQFATEFEEAALITLGLCYQQNGRFSGGGYYSVLKRIETFLSTSLPAALATRRERAERLLELDRAVVDVVTRLKKRGFESPYLKAFVLARINPLRFRRAATADWDDTIDKMLAAAQKFDTTRIKADQVARASGPEPDSP